MDIEGMHFSFIDLDYKNNTFMELSKGFESEKEGGERCHRCYKFRLKKAAELAKEYGCDFFSTTLTVSPYKNADVINSIGSNLELEYKVQYLYSDFKKRNGYLQSIELSKKYGLYRQNYCGCIFSMRHLDKDHDEQIF